MAQREIIGRVAVESGRLLILDPALIGEWSEDAPVEGRYDLLAWGEDEGLLSKALGLPLPLLVSDATFDVARQIEEEARELRRRQGWQVAIELRPRSHYWQSLGLAQGPGAGGELAVGHRPAVVVAAGTAPHFYPVQVERNPAGEIARIIIELLPGAGDEG